MEAGGWRIMNFDKMFTTIDMHTAGEPLRIITHGLPPIKGRSILEKRAYCMEHLDELRETLMYEPRGHEGMYGCIITEPFHPEADIGVLFMHNDGWSTMCGHGVIAVVTMMVETGMVEIKSDRQRFVIDCPCGPVTAFANIEAGKVKSVAFDNVPSFLYKTGIEIELDGKKFMTDISYGGAFYAIVEAGDLGLSVEKENLDAFKRWGRAIKLHIENNMKVEHPDEDIGDIYGVIFSETTADEKSDYKNVTIFADRQIDRSPCGSGTAARTAHLFSRKELQLEDTFRHEGITGEVFTSQAVSTTRIGDMEAVVPRVEGKAFITGFHQFVKDPEDTLGGGFLL